MNLPKKADVVIIGGGLTGIAIAYYLAQKKCTDVVILERNKLLGIESTGRNAGGIRAQFGTKVNIEFSFETIKIFENFEKLVGEPLEFNQCGYLFMTENQTLWEGFKKNVKLQNDCGVDSKLVTPEEIKKRYPLIKTEGLLGGTFWQRDGIIDPSSVLLGYEKQARKAGVKIITEAEVKNIETSGKKITKVITNLGEIQTDTVVIAAGAWSKNIGKMVGIDFPAIPLKRQIVSTLPLGIPEDFPMVVNMDTGSYLHRESGGILMGWADPNQKESLSIEADFDYTMEIIERSVPRLPILEQAEILTEWAGLYCTTPDHHEILGKIKEVEGLVCAFGFSGHGIMHASAVGICIAEEIVDGKASFIDIEPLRFERFAQGRLVEEKNVI